MNSTLLLVGGGMGGMATALACARAGTPVTLFEQAAAFSEVGAGIQLGPNAVRVLADWGLTEALRAVAAFPEQLNVRDAHRGQNLGQLRLGARAVARYGHPYATVHRADAHQLLVNAVQALGGDGVPRPTLHLSERLQTITENPGGVQVRTESGLACGGGALVGCDGLWSVVRRHVMEGPARGQDTLAAAQEAPPRFSGHLAYRGLVDPTDLPVALRAQHITAWLGPRLHVVHYPVCAGQKVNVVAVVHGQPTGNPMSWTHQAHHAELAAALGPVHTHLQHMLDAVPQWRQWPLYDRPPMSGVYAHARGRLALVGDAAHPMRPYLAQGAAMALEDAWTLGQLLVAYRAKAGAASPPPWVPLFQRYAQARWARNARVQAAAVRNGRVFHAQGWLRVARNLAMAWGGEHLLDNPWLYSGPAQPPFK
jgi:salicylate hydroxylase